jgi:hypothetical protein
MKYVIKLYKKKIIGNNLIYNGKLQKIQILIM